MFSGRVKPGVNSCSPDELAVPAALMKKPGVNSCFPDELAVPAALMAPVVLLLSNLHIM